MSEKESIIVTGAAGFLGWTFVKLLVDDPKFGVFRDKIGRVRCFDIVEPPLKTLKNPESMQLEFTKVDITKLDSVKEGTKGGFHSIFHFAALVSVSTYVDELVYKVNVLGTKNLAQAAIENNITRFLYASSLETVISDEVKAQVDLDENSPLIGSSYYGKCKIEVEKYLSSISGTKTTDGQSFLTLAIRPLAIIGEGTPGMKNSLQVAKKYQSWGIGVGVPNAKTCFIYVGNMAYGFLFFNEKLKERPDIAGQNLFLKDDIEPMSVIEYFGKFYNYLDITPPKYFVPMWIIFIIAFLLETISFYGRSWWKFTPPITVPIAKMMSSTKTVNDSKARKLGWKPIFSAEESFQRTMEYYKDCK